MERLERAGAKSAQERPAVDMEPYLKRIKPIEGEFDPGMEVGKLKKVEKGQRREALLEFKRTLARQKEAWAACRSELERRIFANPELGRQEMVAVIREFGEHYGFSGHQVALAEGVVDTYLDAHEKAVEARREFPDDLQLLKRLTYMYSELNDSDRDGIFSIKVGPAAIEVWASRKLAEKIYTRNQAAYSLGETRGFASTAYGNLHFIVMPSPALSDRTYNESSTLVHEKEHQTNRILKPHLRFSEFERKQGHRAAYGFLRRALIHPLFGMDRKLNEDLLARYDKALDPAEIRRVILKEYFLAEMGLALGRAKDEFLAMRKGGLRGDLTYVFESSELSYDYLKDIRTSRPDDPLWQEGVKKILIKRYRGILRRAFTSFDALVSKAGYSRDQAIALLSDKPLSQWPKTARRHLEGKGIPTSRRDPYGGMSSEAWLRSVYGY